MKVEKGPLNKYPKELLCGEYRADGKIIEVSLRVKNAPFVMRNVLNIFTEKGIKIISGFITQVEENLFQIGLFLDVSNLKDGITDFIGEIRKTKDIIDVVVSQESFDGMVVDTIHFPLTAFDEKSFTFRVETFGSILAKLYEKFGTGAAVILYEMGSIAGESKVKSIYKKRRMDKSTILKLIMAERIAKGWCVPEIVDFSSKGAIIVAHELFECLYFKGKQDKSMSHFFRGYLAGIFRQLFNKEASVSEVECIAKGDDTCKYVIEVKG
ncbi:MAG: V4R domain-containing protein [Nitrososphaerota archaeon]|nr:V4R domain-containing protein [Nitrososphaerota archaeon]